MRVAVACHDAGGAEMVSAWLKQKRIEHWKAYLAGPAIAVFRRNFGEVPQPNRWDFNGVDLVLCGTSFSSTWEKLTWKMAQSEGVRTAAYLEHWKNYALRFGTKIGMTLPDEVWVTDECAADLARKELPTANIIVKGNPYLDEELVKIRALEAQQKNFRDGFPVERVLCVYGPSDADQDIIFLNDAVPKERTVRHRPHPVDKVVHRSLAEDIAWSDTVVGYDSMALYVALRAGRRVVSVLPSEQELSIPFPGIERC